MMAESWMNVMLYFDSIINKFIVVEYHMSKIIRADSQCVEWYKDECVKIHVIV